MMRKLVIAGLVVVGVIAAVIYYRSDGDAAADAPGGSSGRPGGAAFSRPPMAVEMASATRAPLAEYLTVVGNLEGMTSIDVTSKVSARLLTVRVRIGDRVDRGQVLAEVEDRELREQVKQAEASHEVARATIRQREADLKFAETNLERSRSLFQRNLLPRQEMDDAEARHQAAQAQLDLARAQFEQAKARLEELRITLSNTEIRSPVTGFIGKRLLDPGAFVSSNTPLLSVVEIGTVRLVANLVEKDMRRVVVGTPARVEVDAYPGDQFEGRVARVAPVLDPATRTAQMEIEVPNPGFRLKPGMYSRVQLTVARRENALVVPRNAVVDRDGKKGVFTIGPEKTARFHEVTIGIEDGQRAEILGGLTDGQSIVSTGAAGLREGDRIQLPGDRGGSPGKSPRPQQANGRTGNRPPRS
jgi:membrane fusion protein, multidrug efflux system